MKLSLEINSSVLSASNRNYGLASKHSDRDIEIVQHAAFLTESHKHEPDDASYSPRSKDAGIADFHFHDLRHTFATRLGDAGCNVTTIARLLGHLNIQMSMRYTHASDDTLRNAVEYAQSCRVTNASQTAKQPLTRVAVNT